MQNVRYPSALLLATQSFAYHSPPHVTYPSLPQGLTGRERKRYKVGLGDEEGTHALAI
jgi:hypothetical protein